MVFFIALISAGATGNEQKNMYPRKENHYESNKNTHYETRSEARQRPEQVVKLLYFYALKGGKEAAMTTIRTIVLAYFFTMAIAFAWEQFVEK